MDGTSMVIEVLGRFIVEKDIELEEQRKTIDHLNKKISLFETYIDTYEKILEGEQNENQSNGINTK